jgi:hypothetical protein
MVDASSTSAGPKGGGLLVVLPSAQQTHIDTIVASLTALAPAESLVIATPDGTPSDTHSNVHFVELPPGKPSWTLTAGDFASAHQLAEKNNAQAILILGPESASLSSTGLTSLAHAVTATSADLAIPCYELSARAGLVNSSILYPLSRALFATRARFPLAIDLGLSLRMAERLGVAAQHCLAVNQSDSPLWVANEAMVGSMKIEEIEVGARPLPQPPDPDLNTILPFVTGSLFADIEAKAAFWQRARVSQPLRRQAVTPAAAATDGSAEVASILQGFRLAYANLREIWGLVLPPNTLLGLKRLSLIEGAAFRMPESLWARIVYDFLIAYRLRTINRGHLLGALIPLYLAWVASHINAIASGEDPERHIDTHAAAFEAEKPYLVARWRWPDRFNP